METKKNKKFDLESKRGVFFLSGLTIALLAAVYIIQIESATLFSKTTPDCTLPTVDASDPIPVTFAPEVEKPTSKPTEANTLTSEILDKYLEVDNTTDKNEPDLKVGEITKKDEGVEDIDRPDEFDEVEVITGNLGNLSWVAVPQECAGLRTNEARKECLNDWMLKFINKNAKYPALPRQMGEEEKVFISFLIDEFGKVQEVKSVGGENQMLVNEAVRVVKAMPEFEPASQGAKKARMTMTVPVSFKLH